MELLILWEIINRRKWAIGLNFILFLLTVIIIINVIPPTYEADSNVLINIHPMKIDMMSNVRLAGSGSSAVNYDNELELLKNYPLLEKLINELDLKKNNNDPMTPESLSEASFITKLAPQPAIEVERLDDASILKITASAPESSQAAVISNTLARLYIQWVNEQLEDEYNSIRNYLNNKLVKTREAYHEKLNELESFRKKHHSVDPAQEANQLLNQISSLEESRDSDEKTLAVLKEEMAEANEKLKEQEEYKKQSESYTLNSQLQNLKSSLDQALTGIAVKKIYYTKNHTQYRELEEEINSLKELMSDRADHVLSSSSVSRNPLYDDLYKTMITNYIAIETTKVKLSLTNKTIEEYRNKLNEISGWLTDYEKLKIILEDAEETHKEVLNYAMKMELIDNAPDLLYKIVKPATQPEDPQFPNKKLLAVLAVFLGFFWAFTLGFLLDYIDNSLKTHGDLHRLGGIHLIGTVPKIRAFGKKRLVSGFGPNLPFCEAYKQIRSRLQLSPYTQDLKTIGITSSINREGKSITAANMGITSAMLGQRTLIIDCDFRQPAQAELFNLTTETTLADLLGQSIDKQADIQNSGIDNLWVLPAGALPEGHWQLLESNETAALFRRLKDQYDRIIVDMPAVCLFSDALTMGSHTDGILYVIAAGKANENMVRHGIDLLEKAHLPLSGYIFNRASSSQTASV